MTPLEESNKQFIAAWKVFCGRLPNGTTEEFDGVVAVFGHIPLPFFNFCFLTRPMDDMNDLRRRVAAAVEYGLASSVPWFLGLCQEWVPQGSDGVCRQFGLGQALRLTGMAADSLAGPRRPLPALAYSRVSDQAGCEAIADINSEAYGFPRENGRCLAVPAMWDGDAFPYLGSVNGRAVTCSATIAVEGRLYVGWVATLPEYHRRGYAEAVMRHSLRQAAEHTRLRRTVLHATDAGLPLYRAMGYEVTAQFAVYAPAGPQAERAH